MLDCIQRIQNYIFDVWKRVSMRFGYEEYGAPMLEPLEVYTAKSGQELASEQTYTFTDRGNRTVAGPGISPQMLARCETMVQIEQFGSTRSVNVGVAAGIVMYAWLQRHGLDI